METVANCAVVMRVEVKWPGLWSEEQGVRKARDSLLPAVCHRNTGAEFQSDLMHMDSHGDAATLRKTIRPLCRCAVAVKPQFSATCTRRWVAEKSC